MRFSFYLVIWSDGSRFVVWFILLYSLCLLVIININTTAIQGLWILTLNPRTAKLFQLTFAAKGGFATPPPGIWSSRPNFFVTFFMGIVSGSRNPKVIVRIFYLYHVTLKLKVIYLVHGCEVTPWPSLSRSRSGSTSFIYRFSNSLTQKT